MHILWLRNEVRYCGKIRCLGARVPDLRASVLGLFFGGDLAPTAGEFLAGFSPTTNLTEHVTLLD